MKWWRRKKKKKAEICCRWVAHAMLTKVQITGGEEFRFFLKEDKSEVVCPLNHTSRWPWRAFFCVIIFFFFTGRHHAGSSQPCTYLPCGLFLLFFLKKKIKYTHSTKELCSFKSNRWDILRLVIFHFNAAEGCCGQAEMSLQVRESVQIQHHQQQHPARLNGRIKRTTSFFYLRVVFSLKRKMSWQ